MNNNCNSCNVILLMTCKICGLQYVGSITTKFRLRFNNCRLRIRREGILDSAFCLVIDLNVKATWSNVLTCATAFLEGVATLSWCNKSITLSTGHPIPLAIFKMADYRVTVKSFFFNVPFEASQPNMNSKVNFSNTSSNVSKASSKVLTVKS